MNFDARLPQFAPHNLKPETIRDICISQSQGLNLVSSNADRETFRKEVAYQLDAYKRGAVRYAVRLMGCTYTNKRSFQSISEAVANAWICQVLREAA